ncbi:MAG TPA: prenyltransferase/squalene oxidase repeat-containing protein [Methanomassiliicoccales archaeon]|nr:prenyltransferase/squalene oxidase repeat-containing protein [Methanomassiliicoccales archaeon]
MNPNGLKSLPFDPLPILLGSRSTAVRCLAGRDLLGKDFDPERLWKLEAPRRLLAKQRTDGSWKYPGRPKVNKASYDTLQTYRVLGDLVEKFAFDATHQAVARAADFILSSQTEEGDIRGIYGRQYSPNYTAGMMEILIKAGLATDARVERAMRWLFGMRQDDGGWAVPLRTAKLRYSDAMKLDSPVMPERSRPFSHLVTGIVLRAFAADPAWSENPEVRLAGELLASRFFKADVYPDRKSPLYWKSTSFPFWWTDIVSSLDAISKLGITPRNPHVQEALSWIASTQKPSGHFSIKMLAGARELDLDDWLVLAISRVFCAMAVPGPDH